MKRKLLLQIFISIPFIAVVLLNIGDVVSVYTGSGGYPFGSEFFGPHSIYKSRAVYVCFQVVSILFLMGTIFWLFRSRRKLFLVFVIIDVLIFFYPMLTNT